MTSSVLAFDVAYDCMRPLAVDLDFVQAVTQPHLVHDALVAFVVRLTIVKHVAVVKLTIYFV